MNFVKTSLDNKNKIKRKLSLTLFWGGFLIGLLLAATAIWADLEAALFDPSISAQERLDSLRCPLIMTSGEVRQVSAAFTNDRDKPTNISVRAHFTAGAVTLIQANNSEELLQPGETRRLSWPVSMKNVVFDRLILVRISNLRSPSAPSRQGACGILVLNWPSLRGWFITTAALTAALLGMGSGAFLWLRAHQPLDASERKTAVLLAAMAGFLMFGLAAGALGWWLPGTGLLILLFILMIANLEQLVM